MHGRAYFSPLTPSKGAVAGRLEMETTSTYGQIIGWHGRMVIRF
jgi:hypothetical protein